MFVCQDDDTDRNEHMVFNKFIKQYNIHNNVYH